MYRRTAKSKAMAAAHYVLEVVNAPIITNSLAQGCVWSATELTQWLQERDSTPDMPGAIEIALMRFSVIEKRAVSIQSDPIDPEILMNLHEAIKELRRVNDSLAAPVSLKSKSESKSDGETTESSAESSGKSSSVDEQQGVQMPEDLRRCRVKASLHFIVFFVLLIIVQIAGVISIVLISREKYDNRIDDLQKNLTMDLAHASRETLLHLQDHLSQTENQADLTPATASSILSDMTTAYSGEGGAQKLHVSRDNRITEYRGAQQDFSNRGIVEAVVTSRNFAGICMKRSEYPIRSLNDIDANQKAVFDILSPQECANDAAFGGIFQGVTPGFIKYTEKAETYRRTSAHVASYYHRGFDISVAVTRDKKSIQHVLVPENSLFTNEASDASQETVLDTFTIIWAMGGVALFAVVLFPLLTWAMASRCQKWGLIFPCLIGLVMAGDLVAVTIMIHDIIGNSANQITLLSTASLVKSIGSACLSRKILQYKLSNSLYNRLSKGAFKGRIVALTEEGEKIYPPEMEDLLRYVNGPFIASFRRGQHSTLEKGYAVSTSFVRELGLNLFAIQKLEDSVKLDETYVIILIFSFIGAVISLIYLQCSPLVRLRKYGVGSAFLLTWVEPSVGRYVLYSLVLLLPLAGVTAVAFFSSWQLHYQRVRLSELTVGVLSASFRAESIVDACTGTCGLPSFLLIIYFSLMRSIEFPDGQLKIETEDLSFPVDESEIKHYLGAQMALGDFKTSLVNVPSFATPIVNRTWNGTNPRYISRHLLYASDINETHGFSVEMFPSAYYPATFRFMNFTFSLYFMVALSAIIVTVCEHQYLKLHSLFVSKKSLKKPIVVMVCMVLLVFVGFVVTTLATYVLLRIEVLGYARDCSSLLLHANANRLGLLAMQKSYETQEDLLNFLTIGAAAISESTTLYADSFYRLRIAEEYPQRGSGVVKIRAIESQELVNMGSLEIGLLPQCGMTDRPELFTDRAAGTLLYCYEELPQLADHPSTVPRIFAVSVMGHDVFMANPIKHIIIEVAEVAACVGFVVTGFLLIFLFLTLHAARTNGFPLIRKGSGTSLTEPMPETFKLEFFVPHLERKIWVCSLLLLAGCITPYFIASISFVNTYEATYGIQLAYQTFADVSRRMCSNIETRAYAFPLFPFIDETVRPLLAMSEAAEEGSLQYEFVTDDGLTEFKEAIKDIYNGANSDSGIKANMVLSSKYGYDSFGAIIGSSYDEQIITQQAYVSYLLQSLTKRVLGVGREIIKAEGKNQVLQYLFEVAQVKDNLKKMYIADHMVINSFASIGYLGATSPWPFEIDNEEEIIIAASAAIEDLSALVKSGLNSLSTILAGMPATSSPIFSMIIDEVKIGMLTTTVVGHHTSILWEYQDNRRTQVSMVKDSNLLKTTLIEQKEQLVIIEKALKRVSNATNWDLAYRKNRQLLEYLDKNVPLETVHNTLSWERAASNQRILRRSLVSLGCCVFSFVSVSICILLHMTMMRRRFLLSQKEDWNTSKEETPLLSSLQLPSSMDSSMNKDKEQLPSIQNQNIPFEEQPSEKLVVDRDLARVILPVALCLGLVLVALISSFTLLNRARLASNASQDRVSNVLLLQPQVLQIASDLDKLLPETTKYYNSIVTRNEIEGLATEAARRVIQLATTYLWALRLEESSIVDRMIENANTLFRLLDEELKVYDSMVPMSEQLLICSTAQSRYTRSFLPVLSKENTYGALLPMSVTTDGSAVKKFAEEYLKDAISQAENSEPEQELILYQAFERVFKALDYVSSAELQMWHAVVSGDSIGGTENAVKHSNFTQLVGEEALSSLRNLDGEVSAEDALDEIDAYYELLLEKAGTKEKVIDLFTNTVDEPPPSDPPTSSDAYFAAAYYFSTFAATVSQSGFLCHFAYNRELIDFCSARVGKPTLVSAIISARLLLSELLISATNGKTNLVVKPAQKNLWLWVTQVIQEPVSVTQPLANMVFFRGAVWWSGIAAFWGIGLAAIYGYISLFHKTT